jgi:SAM-dependent methyltransferase
MAEASNPKCPICGGSSTAFYGANGYTFYRCEQCRTAFVHPMPSDELLREHYSRFHRSDDQGGAYDQFEKRMAVTFAAKVKLVKEFSGGNRVSVLDVGCGKGVFVKACVDAGIDAQGIDVSDSGVDYAVQKLGVRAVCGALADLKAQLGRFDTVTFWATLEHLPDSMKMLRDIYEILNPGGRLLLTTASGDDIVERLLPGVTQWYDPPTHLVIYSEPGIRRALEAQGFSVTKIDMCYEYTRARRWMRLTRNTLTAAMLRAAAELGRLPTGGFTVTRFLLGNDLLAVAQKPA